MQVTFKTKESYLRSGELDEFPKINWLDTGTHLPSGNNLELFLENDLLQRKSVLYNSRLFCAEHIYQKPNLGKNIGN